MAKDKTNTLTGKVGDLPGHRLPNGKRTGDATLKEIESAAKYYHAQIQVLLSDARRTNDVHRVHQALELYSRASRLITVALALGKWQP